VELNSQEIMTLYQEIRAAGKAMHNKAMRATRDLEFNPLRIAKRMTVPLAGRTLIFDSEVVQNAFFDFWFHEYRVNGKSLVESVDPVAAGLEPLETEVLEAHRQARTSFFATEAVLPDSHQVRLRDLLEPDRPETLLTDLGLSDSMQRIGTRLALFCRRVEVRGLAMTSGFSFGFEPELIPGILQAHRQRMKRVAPQDLPEARFVFFFQKHRQRGVEQEYQDVV
jgi:hypothetical protein